MTARIRYSPDIFRLQRFGGVSRYFVELHRGMLQRGVDSRILGDFHRNGLLGGVPNAPGVDLDWIRPQVFRQALTKMVDRGLERLRTRRWSRSTIYHKTYFDRWIPEGPTLAVTVYDMVHEMFPRMDTPRDLTIEAKRLWCAAADVVFTISDRTRQDLLEFSGVDPGKVVVTPLGVSRVTPHSAPPVRRARPYLLYVGERRSPHKNFARLVQAFAECQSSRETCLVCFGGGALSREERNLLVSLRVDDRVVGVGGSDDVLASWYAGAQALVYPSLYEGFGLPPLEAMAQSCPVVAAAAGAIPETVGDAALLFDPLDTDALAAALDRIVYDEGLRVSLIEKGSERVKLFTWDRMVDLTLAAYGELL